MKLSMPLLLLLILVSCQQEEFSPNRTSEFSIHSTATDTTYTIKVAVPQNYDPQTQTYATVYVLDGEENFSLVAEQCDKISSALSTSNILVVSIGYGHDRAYDYTPSDTDNGGGGAEVFMRFIRDELIPTIERDFGADTSRDSRVILGHSFGGLLAAYAFTNFNNVFGHYLMLSPSIWYDNEIILRMEQANRIENSQNPQLVYMGLGELEKLGRMQAPFQAFYLKLEAHYPGIKLEKHLEPKLDHMGSKNPNIIRGLQFYFQNR